MQIVFNQDDLRAMLMRYLLRFEEEMKIDFAKSVFTFRDRQEYFTSLDQLALEVVPDE